MMTFKAKVIKFVVENWDRFDWVQDKNSNYTDFEANLVNGSKLRVVSNREGKYLQILKSPTNYQCYNEKDYPEIASLLKNIVDRESNKRAEKFFEDIYNVLMENY